MPVAMRAWEFTQENRTIETAQHFRSLLTEVAADAQKAKTLRGTVAITFPDEEFPAGESPLMSPEVQSFLRQLFERIPEILYYLSDAPIAAAFLEYAAAFHPDCLLYGGDGAPGVMPSSQLLEDFALALRTAGQFAESQGQPASIVLPHLTQFPDDVRKAMARVVTE